MLYLCSDSVYDVNGHPVDSTHPAYSQSAAIGEPLVYANGDGKQTHYRYDSRGNALLVIDALGNETDYTYNLADQVTSMAQYTPWSAAPSHSLISKVVYGYSYVGGQLVSEQTQDGSGNAVRETDYGYGNEGELLSEWTAPQK